MEGRPELSGTDASGYCCKHEQGKANCIEVKAIEVAYHEKAFLPDTSFPLLRLRQDMELESINLDGSHSNMGHEVDANRQFRIGSRNGKSGRLIRKRNQIA